MTKRKVLIIGGGFQTARLAMLRAVLAMNAFAVACEDNLPAEKIFPIELRDAPPEPEFLTTRHQGPLNGPRRKRGKGNKFHDRY